MVRAKECPQHLSGEDSRTGAFYGANSADRIELSLARVSDAAPPAEIEPLDSYGTTGSLVRAPAVPPTSSSCCRVDGS